MRQKDAYEEQRVRIRAHNFQVDQVTEGNEDLVAINLIPNDGRDMADVLNRESHHLAQAN